MKMTNPSDTLKKPAHRAGWIISGAATLAIAVSAVIAGPSIAYQLNPAPTPTATFQPAEQTGSVNRAPAVSAEDENTAMAGVVTIQTQQAQEAADALAAQQAAAAAAAQAAAEASRNSSRQSNSGGLPAGAVVPMNNNGFPDTTKCASSSASNNADGVAVCD